MIKLALLLSLFIIPAISEATILACSDRIEKMMLQKEKEGLGDLGKAICKDTKKGAKARYRKDTDWECKTFEDYPCVGNEKLRMVQCDREWECVK